MESAIVKDLEIEKELMRMEFGCEMQRWLTQKRKKQENQKWLRSKNHITMSNKKNWPLWEVFIRSKAGLSHRHSGSLHAADAEMALEVARDVYTRRNEGVSIWVVESNSILASDPDAKDALFDPANDKIYRHPTFYELPDEVKYM